MIKKLFKATAGTPVTPASCTLTTNKLPENLSMAKQISLANSSNIWKKAFSLVISGIKFVSRVFAGAIIFVVLAHFAPELREQLPSFYQIVDFLLVCFEWLCTQLVNIF